MPIYEYMCANCNGRFQKLVAGFRDPSGLTCPRCKSEAVKRAVSRFAMVRSDEARLDMLANPSMLSGLDENDPQSVARWAKKLGKEMGDEAGEDWDEMIDQMMEEEETGEDGKGAGTAPDNLGWG